LATRREASTGHDAEVPAHGGPRGSIRLSRRSRSHLLTVAVVTVLGAAIGAANAWLLSRLVPFEYDLAEFENGLRNGAMIGACLIALELFYVQEPRGAWLRRASFAFGILDRATLYAVVIIATLSLNRLIFGLLHGFERSNLDYFGLPLLRDAVFSFLVFLVISFVLQMRRVVGGRVLTNLLLGRYHRPVREERVFMLVDLKGSTALADRLGDERAHAFITSVFFDIDQPIQEHGGEVYSYVGDGLIATWPLKDGVADARCLRCHLEIRAILETRASAYLRDFGVVPSVRAALHAGPVVAGECGDAKLSIVYLGDTLNTAARIEQTAKELDRDCLISEPLLQQLRVPPSLHVESLGSISLRGRQQPMDLFALSSGPAAQRGTRSGAREEACAISPS
jgi:adenylate cyclase